MNKTKDPSKDRSGKVNDQSGLNLVDNSLARPKGFLPKNLLTKRP